MNIFFHSGDFGDCIAALPVIRQLGGGKLVLGKKDGRWGQFPMTRERFGVIAPLLRSQEYVSEAIFEDDYDGEITHCFHNFRTKPPPYGNLDCGELGYNLATWQGEWFGIKDKDLDLSPWLHVPRLNVEYQAVFARSLRYQNPFFNWRTMLDQHPNAIFVGLPEEHAAFPESVNVRYIPTCNLLEVASLIASSDIFIGNQSAPCWTAIGLGHRLIQEMDQCVTNRNSVVKRDNAQFLS